MKSLTLKKNLTSENNQSFKIESAFISNGDQPEAIKKLVKGINKGEKEQYELLKAKFEGEK